MLVAVSQLVPNQVAAIAGAAQLICTWVVVVLGCLLPFPDSFTPELLVVLVLLVLVLCCHCHCRPKGERR
jgi:hypothetical protein